MNVFLWIVQAVLAALFALSGLQKVGQPIEKMTGRYPWMGDVSATTVRFIGVMEVLGAIGLILPAATGIAPILTPIAATGLALLMAVAVLFHIRRGEAQGVVVAGILLVITALLAGLRFGPYSF
jgi:uncharacterized membrane protein YphA (DoxX/SURF4 family)